MVSAKITGLMPTIADLREAFAPIMRGTFLGSILGVLPGGGAMLSSFASYVIEKKLSSTPEQFGRGALAGVAGPESANNAGAQTSFVPMLTLGIPSNPIMALMVGALIIQGIAPGPNLITEKPALFWGVIASMWIGNLMLRDPQFAAGRAVGEAPDREEPLSLSGDHGILGHRRLQRRQQHFRSLHDGAVRRDRLCADQARMRAGAATCWASCSARCSRNICGRTMILSDGSPAIFFQRPISAGLLLPRRSCC